MLSNGFELFVEVDGSRRIPEYGHRGKTYVEGRRGYRYTLKFRNSRPERVLVIPSIDGLSVVDGQPATEASSGYIVQAYSSVTISGWRTSLSEIRQFEFSDRSGSYAGKTEGQSNCGVIAAMVYAEAHPIPQVVHIHHTNAPPWPIMREPWITYGGSTLGGIGSVGSSAPQTDLNSPAVPPQAQDYCAAVNTMNCVSAAPASAPAFNLGTAFGAAAQDHVTQAQFNRGFWLATLELYYSDREGLEKDGIQVNKSPELVTAFPQAFRGFCKPPSY